ncbi:MAG: PIN domain-containing protein [Prolixibacteraceae bacterium]|nr:PIN domain-containing protein [Prolixibacteraceae bacterium]
MKIIVDTNIVFSAILNSQSRIGQLLLHSGKSIQFYSPIYLQKELFLHSGKIKEHTLLIDSEIDELTKLFYSKITFISEDFIPKEILREAEKLTIGVDFDDIIFVALAIHLKCRLLTGDKKLMKHLSQKGFERLITFNELYTHIKK